MSNDFMPQHGAFKNEFNPNDINVSQYNHYSQGLFGQSTPFYSQTMSQQHHQQQPQQQQQQQINEMDSRRSSQGTTNRNWTGADLMQFNPMSLFSTTSNVSQTNTPSPLNALHNNSQAFSSSSAAAAQQLARLGGSASLGAIRGINMDVATSSGLAAVAAAAFEAANAQMPGMGHLAPEEQRLCAVCNDQARGRHYGIYR
uniref:Uncharacterized protein n=1 Tax=Panagrolaimus sp. ES5 TaxID=591445 RepID=A0AC34F9Q6_9BILA